MPPSFRVSLSFLAACVLSTASAAPLTALDAKQQQAIDAAARKVLKATDVPSASIAVVVDGKLAYTQAYGDAALDPKRAATPAMRYGIGSISKQFLATAMVMLQQEGKLSLDDKVSKYLPDLGPAGEVTLRQLLSHTAGIRDYWPQDYMFADMKQPTTPQAIVDRWAKKPLDFAPGERWQYSNTGYTLAGMVLEKVSGKPVFDFLQEKIFAPLDMQTTFDVDRNPMPPADSVGYTSYALGPLEVAPRSQPGWLFAAAELAMTPADLAKWDISLIDRKLLSPAGYQTLEREVVLKDGAGTKYALGMDVFLTREHRVLEHGGEIDGYVAENIVIPESRMAIVVLTNTDASSAASDIASDIEDQLFDAESADQASLDEARAILTGLQHGKLDRARFSANGNDYFQPAVVREAARQLAKLGELKSFKSKSTSTRGGMTTHVYRATFAKKTLTIVARIWPDGKYEQYTLEAE